MSLEGLNIGRYAPLTSAWKRWHGRSLSCNDMPVNRQVAIKVMRAEAAPYPDMIHSKRLPAFSSAKFKLSQELIILNILPLYDYGEDLVPAQK